MDMREQVYYHVVTERPVQVGQVITFDDTHHSGVWQRVMDKLPQVEEIYANPEQWNGASFEHHLSVALRELALEEVRKAEFPQYPSRMGCLYVSEKLEEAQQWFEFFKGIRPTFQIVKLTASDESGKVFRGNATLCFDGTADREENLRLARKYWQVAETEEPPIWEILMGGKITVTEILRENEP